MPDEVQVVFDTRESAKKAVPAESKNHRVYVILGNGDPKFVVSTMPDLALGIYARTVMGLRAVAREPGKPTLKGTVAELIATGAKTREAQKILEQLQPFLSGAKPDSSSGAETLPDGGDAPVDLLPPPPPPPGV